MQDAFIEERYNEIMMQVQRGANVQARVEQMNVGWRNYIMDAMGLDPETFQAAQGTLGLQTDDSSGLFLMADSVPPYSAMAFFDASGSGTRYNAYGSFLNCLLPSTAAGMKKALGPMYAEWKIFAKTNATKYATVEQMFDAFAMGNLDPTMAKAGRQVLAQAANDPLSNAFRDYANPNFQTTFVNDANQPFGLPSYTGTISNANKAIANGQSVDIDFSTNSMDTKSTSTIVSGGASGMYEIFFGGANGEYSASDEKASQSAFSIKGRIGSYATMPTQAAGWYNGSMVTHGYNAKDDFNVWDAESNSGDWYTFFNEKTGSLARRVSQIVLVTDLELTVTSEASYSQSEFEQIKTEAQFGVWPFFSAKASGTHTSSYQLNADGSLSYHYTLPKGKTAIWGVTVQPAPQ
ncbi:hypothetical protein [Palleronia abyssalis]|uniref:Uncharacterized protein n=1 Tax=Palleronia abyssalis TaxID=1501240 RepID=A0A2R8BWL7_9RHOB|nr:hypothetical protein [Palleronia abyssalis]SPJ24561.1 hypothetical protein PAA8504_02394 [Palleronia abyssalis]